MSTQNYWEREPGLRPVDRPQYPAYGPYGPGNPPTNHVKHTNNYFYTVTILPINDY